MGNKPINSLRSTERPVAIADTPTNLINYLTGQPKKPVTRTSVHASTQNPSQTAPATKLAASLATNVTVDQDLDSEKANKIERILSHTHHLPANRRTKCFRVESDDREKMHLFSYCIQQTKHGEIECQITVPLTKEYIDEVSDYSSEVQDEETTSFLLKLKNMAAAGRRMSLQQLNELCALVLSNGYCLTETNTTPELLN